MSETTNLPVEIRVFRKEDLPACLAIDAEIFGKPRQEIVQRRLERALGPGRVTTSLVAVTDDKVVGFVLGDVLVGEFGATEQSATIDTIGVAPAYQKRGVARRLLRAYVNHLRALQVEHVRTLVPISDWRLLRFLTTAGFAVAQAVSLELDLSDLRPGQWGDWEGDAVEHARTP